MRAKPGKRSDAIAVPVADAFFLARLATAVQQANRGRVKAQVTNHHRERVFGRLFSSAISQVEPSQTLYSQLLQVHRPTVLLSTYDVTKVTFTVGPTGHRMSR